MFENLTGGCGRAGNACLNVPHSWPYRKENLLFRKVTEQQLSWFLERPSLKVWTAGRLLCLLSRHLPWVSINNHAVYNPSLYCLCVCMVHMQINTYGTCMEYAICVIRHICGIFKSLRTYIYTALLLSHSDGSVFEKWRIMFVPFTEFKYRCLTVRRKFLLKTKQKKAYFPKFSDRK